MKKGLKVAEQILRRFPEHGDTLAMKALMVNDTETGDKEKNHAEALALVRKGVMANMKSHIVWHVYGMLHKSNRDYHQAIKCYQNALRQKPDHLQVLKDIATLQVQMRDLKGHAETRRVLLTMKPNDRTNWLGYAVANQMAGLHDVALSVLDAYLQSERKGEAQKARLGKQADDEKNKKKQTKGERDGGGSGVASAAAGAAVAEGNDESKGLEEEEEKKKKEKKKEKEKKKVLTRERAEVHMLRALILEEKNDLEGALAYYKQMDGELRDAHAILQRSASMLLRLERYDEALSKFNKLVQRNPEHLGYHRGLQCCVMNDHSPWLVRVGTHGSDSCFSGTCLPVDTRKLSNSQVTELIEVYQKLVETHPKSNAPRHILMRLRMTDDTNKAKQAHVLDQHLRPFLRKGVPAFFNVFRPLYAKEGSAPYAGERHCATAVRRCLSRGLSPSPSAAISSLEASSCLAYTRGQEGERGEGRAVVAAGAQPRLDQILREKEVDRMTQAVEAETEEGEIGLVDRGSPFSSLMGDLLESYLVSLRTKDTRFPPLRLLAGEEGGGEVSNLESPSTLLHVLSFAAQHYDAIGAHDRALELLEEAISHTPTILDLQCRKARVLKHMGKISEAAKVMERARKMDTADRYVNTKSAKYLMRDNQVERAIDVLGRFTRFEGNIVDDLNDMQVSKEEGRREGKDERRERKGV